MTILSVTRLNYRVVRDTLEKSQVEVNLEPSLVIVEKCLTVQELLQRAIQGLPVNVVRFHPSGFDEEFSGNEDLDGVNTTFDDYGDDNLVHLCAARKISYRIEQELKSRESKKSAQGSEAAAGAVESSITDKFSAPADSEAVLDTQGKS